MLLLIILTVLTFLTAFAHTIAKPIKEFLKRPSREERKIIGEIAELNAKLSGISMQNEYTTYVRVDRQILALQTRLSTIRSEKLTKDIIVNYGVGYGIQIIFSLFLVILSLTYRRQPVIVFDNRFNFAPFGGVIAFPTGVSGAVSVPFWIFVSNFTFRSVASYLNL